ncbi:uclacyanin 1-like [Ananas comosus]|uniref:Blue copper protein n=1 Tax=Ananas comosus TaxID=4615 RepID=A0A199VVK4_ANACO|nr:uclacyanin 1-like [Ananas comosus]OAY81028.1 Blue copper protein [Ananas comosus]
MASVRAALVCIASMAAMVRFARSADYTVGGPSGGWDTSTDLKTWATNQKLAVGDSLTFTYQSFHDVVEVKKSGYDSCSAANSLATYTGGRTAIPLASPGKRYFICGVPGHCTAGMKLEVDVLPSAASPPPTATASPPHSPKHSSNNRHNSKPPAASPANAPTSSEAISAPPERSSDFQPVKAAPAAAPTSAAAVAGCGRWVNVALGALAGLGLLAVVNL